MTPLDLTIAIPVRNEEANLPGCLKAIGKNLARKIVVIDSESSDRTKEIACEFGVEIVNFKWNGKFPKKRNWYLQNHNISTSWILFLDADEYLTEDFKTELGKKLPDSDKVGYWLKYSIHYMGKKLKGGYPLKKLALFRHDAGEYERIEEDYWSNLDMEVHEHPVLSGEIGFFKATIDHQDLRSVKYLNLKHNEYAIWEARRFLKMKNDSSITGKWTWKQRIKYHLMGTVWIGPAFFFGSFIFLRGFLDGSRGLAFAIFKMSYFNQVYCNIREQEKLNRDHN
jgi:glycosyltransferase involved in cell wall biosynthesis